jgi:hypothetical protein
MKPEHLKLAGIVTMVCGGMSSLGAGATGSDSPTVASGRIIPLRSAAQRPAPGTMDAAALDAAAVKPDAAWDSAPVLDAPTLSAEADAQVGASAESEDAQAARATIALSGDATPVTVSLASNVVHVDDVADVADVRAVAETADVADVAHVDDVADVPRAAHVADVAHVAAVPHAAHITHVAATPANGEVQRDQAALKLGGAVDVITMAAHPMQPADAGAHATAAPVERHTAAPRTAQSDDAWASADLVAVDEHRLDNMRGGFDGGSGLVVSFGITREAFVNGTLVTSTSFNIPNIAQMTPQQAQMLANANAGALIQNGLNNTVQPGGLPALTGAVIQNTLSNQQIQALTTINTTVNSLAAFRSLNLGQTLNSALLSAVRPR